MSLRKCMLEANKIRNMAVSKSEWNQIFVMSKKNVSGPIFSTRMTMMNHHLKVRKDGLLKQKLNIYFSKNYLLATWLLTEILYRFIYERLGF